MWTWVGFLSGLKRVSYLSSDELRKDSIEALQKMVKVCIPTITKQALRYELSFHASEPWPIVIGQIANSSPNRKACVLSKINTCQKQYLPQWSRHSVTRHPRDVSLAIFISFDRCFAWLVRWSRHLVFNWGLLGNPGILVLSEIHG
jgi:hypothetical protein